MYHFIFYPLLVLLHPQHPPPTHLIQPRNAQARHLCKSQVVLICVSYSGCCCGRCYYFLLIPWCVGRPLSQPRYARGLPTTLLHFAGHKRARPPKFSFSGGGQTRTPKWPCEHMRILCVAFENSSIFSQEPHSWTFQTHLFSPPLFLWDNHSVANELSRLLGD